MNSCKVVQDQDKSMKLTCPPAHGSGCSSNLTSTNNLIADVKELNTLSSSTVAKAIKIKKSSNVNPNNDSNLDAKSDNFNFENLEIGEYSDS